MYIVLRPISAGTKVAKMAKFIIKQLRNVRQKQRQALRLQTLNALKRNRFGIKTRSLVLDAQSASLSTTQHLKNVSHAHRGQTMILVGIYALRCA